MPIIDNPTKLRTLVFCSAGLRIHELSWLAELSSYEQMDSAIVYYGPQPFTSRIKSRYFLVNQDFKIPNFLKLILQFDEALDYDIYIFIDDDINISANELSRWREIIWKEELDISQPALTISSKINWPHTQVQPSIGTDHNQFVEIQCFALTRTALRAALPYFYFVKTGTGLDVILYNLAMRLPLRSGVIHEIQMHHPLRPEVQTVRTQFSEFHEFNRKMMRLIQFCFEKSPVTFTDLVIASKTLGDTRPSTVRWIASMRFVFARLIRKATRLFHFGPR